MPGTWWPSRCSARISGVLSSAIHILWLCRSPRGVRPSLIGSQQASGVSSGMITMLWPRGWAYSASGAAVLVAGGYAAIGVPGQVAVCSAMTRRPGAPAIGRCRPSHAGRNTRRQ
jgi:hypothetical protein